MAEFGAVDVSYAYPQSGLLGSREKKLAVEGVSVSISRGEIHALVGESGSGKSTLGRIMLRLQRPNVGGVFLDGADIWTMGREEIFRYRAKVQAVFQDPIASVSPRRKIRAFMWEPMKLRPDWSKDRCEKQIAEFLRLVGLHAEVQDRYARELSGGELQRVVLARGLSIEPEFLVLDEPLSALDVVVQAEMIALIREVREKVGTGLLLIAHDLVMCRELADTVSVMRLGSVVESGPIAQVYENPTNEYTRALLAAASAPTFAEE
jgi:oligopeptide transport system ATP-binding protein